VHLFGDSSGPHLAHFRAHREDDHVDLHWEVRNAGALRWRVLRSEQDFAESADPVPAGQMLISESSEGHVCDRRVDTGTPYFYTVFVRDEQGLWQLQVTVKLAPREHLRWLHPAYEDLVLAEKLDTDDPVGAVNGETDAKTLHMNEDWDRPLGVHKRYTIGF
jgi:hypothetical protein